jgi:hypothetical protein
MRDRLRAWLNSIPFQNSIERRQASIVQMLLLVLIGTSILAQPLLIGGDGTGGAILSTIPNALLPLLISATLINSGLRDGRCYS